MHIARDTFRSQRRRRTWGCVQWHTSSRCAASQRYAPYCVAFFSSQIRGKSKTGCQTWLPPSSIHWLQATTSRLPSPAGDWLSTAPDAGLPTPARSAGLQTTPCSCTVPSGDRYRLPTTGTLRPRTVSMSRHNGELQNSCSTINICLL